MDGWDGVGGSMGLGFVMSEIYICHIYIIHTSMFGFHIPQSLTFTDLYPIRSLRRPVAIHVFQSP